MKNTLYVTAGALTLSYFIKNGIISLQKNSILLALAECNDLELK